MKPVRCELLKMRFIENHSVWRADADIYSINARTHIIAILNINSLSDFVASDGETDKMCRKKNYIIEMSNPSLLVCMNLNDDTIQIFFSCLPPRFIFFSPLG